MAAAMTAANCPEMTAVAPRLQSWRLSLPPAGMPASLLLHVAIVALIVLAQFAPAVDVPAITSVEVELVSMAQFAALAPPPVPAPTMSVPAPAEGAVAPSTGTAVEAAPAPSNGPFRATTFYAGGLLAEPASAKLRQAMGTLADPERVVQLCDIEAMEQVRRARPDYDPDMVVPYAMADMATADRTLVAAGGAFRSRREWYEISFRCMPSRDFEHVETFEFTLGDAIPHELWDAHYLTAEEMEE